MSAHAEPSDPGWAAAAGHPLGAPGRKKRQHNESIAVIDEVAWCSPHASNNRLVSQPARSLRNRSADASLGGLSNGVVAVKDR
jgi:hypothetical protein